MEGIKYLTQQEATDMDVELMGPEMGFDTHQLMELAGLSCAVAIHKVFGPSSHPRPLIVVGPGNNGGDGLVCARHLYNFGYKPQILYPVRKDIKLYQDLSKQCTLLDIPFLEGMPAAETLDKEYDVIVDAIFGYSFKGSSLRAPFDAAVKLINDSTLPIVALDVPSGWDIDKGDIHGIGIREPQLLVSLATPKLCARSFKGTHYLGGRFIPPCMDKKYRLNLPPYPGNEQVVDITSAL